MSYIFKIYINNNNSISGLYLYINNLYTDSGINLKESIDDLNSKYNKSENFIKSEIFEIYFKVYFNTLDIHYFNDYSFNIFFIDENIYLDDTFEIIKMKFVSDYNNLLKEDLEKITFEELYMYGLINKTFDPINIYKNLSNTTHTHIPLENLKNYLLNLNEQIFIYNKLLENNNNEEKLTYDYEDIKRLPIDSINILSPIGQYVHEDIKNVFITNPYELLNNTQKINGSVSSNNHSLLFENNIVNNTLYICKLSDVVLFYDEKKILSTFGEQIIKLYYPLLYNNNIKKYETFLEKKKELFQNNKKFIESDNFKLKSQIANIFNNIQFDKTILPNNYSDNGINYINFNIHTNINFSLSLETLFKLINSSKVLPFVKYNPGKRYDNIFRLYCNKETTNNEKIPTMSKHKIIKYSKTIGKKNTISIVVSNNDFEPFIKYVNEFIFEIDIYGCINVKITFKKNVTITIINLIVQNSINSYINNIKKYISNEDANFSEFNSLFDENIEIISMNYNINIISSKSLKELSKIKNCIQFYFNIISDKVNEKEWRYKHVSNYNELNDKEVFIIELIKQNESPKKIVDRLEENFKISFDEAKKTFEDLIQSLNIVQNIFNYKKLKIKESPGFLVKINNNVKDTININVFNIDSIYYLKHIDEYIDSIFKLAFNDIKDIDTKICKKIKKIDAVYIDDDMSQEDEEKKYDLKDNKNILDKSIDPLKDEEIKSINLSEQNEDSDNDLMDILLLSDDEDAEEAEEEYEDNDSIEEEDKKDLIEKTPTIITKKDKEELDTKDEEGEHDEHDEDNEDDEDEDYEDEDAEDNEPILDEEDSITEASEKKEKKSITKFKESTKDNPKLKRLKTREPTLFTSKIYKPNMKKEELNKQMECYSRICQLERQPVILNESEKEIFIKEHPDFKKERILEYSSNPDDKNYFICPEFWDVEREKVLTKEQVESGEYGTIHSKLNESGNIYKSKDEHHIPLFLKKDKVIDSNNNIYCLPCCFKKYNPSFAKCDSKKPDTKITDNKYILRENKFPLEQHKLGHLPIKISKFLQFNSEQCISSENTLIFKYVCLLRYGVENNYNNSFLACIADVYSKEILKTSNTISINDFKNVLIQMITVDKFIVYNNGNLPHIFLSKNIDENILNSFNIEESFLSSEFYKNLDKINKNQINLYKKIIIAFMNFKEYLLSNDYIVDYTYLWDIICKPDRQLFPDGINLLILDMTNYDITDNVKVICPKQNYSNERLDPNKKCCILIKNNNYIEPVYIVKSDLNNIITPLISFDFIIEESTLNEFKKVLNTLKNNINEECNVTSQYEFKSNITLRNLINIINKVKYNINYQIINYENKIIGVVVSNEEKFKGYRFIPCYPSSIFNDNDIPIKFMDDHNDPAYYNDYNTTKDFLNEIYELSNKIIQVKPLYKVKYDELIVGILTSGNQFVMLNKPETYIDDELEEINNKNYLINDIIIQTKFTKDEEREKMISNIKLESGFYNSFKNTLIILLNRYSNVKNKIQIKNIITDTSITYYDKIHLIRNIIEIISEDYIIFALYDDKILNNIKNIALCNSDTCDTDFCMKNDKSNICNLVIPQNNLLTNENNKDIYFTRVADEFIRYRNTQYKLLNNNYNLTNKIKYNINTNELLVYEVDLIKSLFDSNIIIRNPLENYNTYDNISNSKKYDVKKIDIASMDVNYKNIVLDKIQTNQQVSIKVPQKTKEQIDIKAQEILDKKSKEDVSKEDVSKEDVSKEDVTKSFENKVNEFTFNDECKIIKKKIIIEKELKKSFNKNIYETFFVINSLDKRICSYELILFIINDFFNNKRNISLENVQNILKEEYFNHKYSEALIEILKYYNKNSVIDNILTYLKTKKYEDETEYRSLPDIKKYIDEFIMHEEYFISYIDIYLLCKKFNIPIIFICSTSINKAITPNNFIIVNKNTESDLYYFIKVPSTYLRGQKNYTLLHFEQDIKINISTDINSDNDLRLQSSIEELLIDYEDPIEKYIEKYHKEIIISKKRKIKK